MLNETERKERRASIMRLINGTETPHMFDVPIPHEIRDQKWFRKVAPRTAFRMLPGFKLGRYSGKLPAVVGCFNKAEREGKLGGDPKIGVCATSGNFGKDAAAAAPAWGMGGFKAVVNADTPEGKIHHLETSNRGIRVIVAPEGKSAIEYSYEIAAEPNHVLFDQYTDEGAVEGHWYTAMWLAGEMRRFIGGAGFIAVGVTGTCTYLTAQHRYLRPIVPGGVKIVGVASMSKAEKVPGSRSPEDLAKLRDINGVPGFPYREEWKSVLDFPIVTSVTRDETYRLNPELIERTDQSIGPTGTLAVAGAIHLLRDHVERGEESKLENEDRQFNFAIWGVDSYLAYKDDPTYRSYWR